MRIKIEHLRDKDKDKDKDNDGNSDYIPTRKTIIRDAESGEKIGGIQKINIVFDAHEFVPKATLEFFNFELNLDDVEANLECSEFSIFSPYFLRISEMGKDQLVESLRSEAEIRFKQNIKIRVLEKRIKELEK